MELFEAIRRDAPVEELSIRALAERHGVHRRTVRQALASAVPPARKTPVRVAPKLDPAKAVDRRDAARGPDAPRKQRHTARRVLARLVDEHELTGLTYSAVRDYVAKRRPEIWAAAGKAVEEAFVPQTHAPGAEAEVDFADLWIELAGVKTKVFLFTLRLSFSGKAVHRAYATQAQEAFLEGHRYAFEQLGGIPAVHIRYDNLKAAVSRVLFGPHRVESDRWVAFRSHYGFDAFYCHPGVEGAHEKGGVEGEGGRFRRNHLVPVPKVDTMAELNELLIGYDLADDARRIGNRTMSVGQHFAFEAGLLRPLPAEVFETGLTLTPRVDRYARVTVRQCHYSVPAKLIGRRVRVLLRATEVLVFDGARQVAVHPRATARGGEVPGAGPLPGGAGAQARRAARRDRAGPGPLERRVHAHPCRVLGGGPQDQRRRLGRHPRPGRGVAAAPPPTRRRGHRRHASRAHAGRHHTGRGRRRGPPRRHRPHRHRTPAGRRWSRRVLAVLACPEQRRAGPELPTDERPLPTVVAYDQLLRRRSGTDPDTADPDTCEHDTSEPDTSEGEAV